MLAAVDYHIDHFITGSIVYDGFDPVKDYFERQKIKADTYFGEGRLDMLQQQLNKLIRGPWLKADLQFVSYIKEKTGYNLDLFSDLPTRIDGIVANGKIETEEEREIVDVQLHIYKNTVGDTQKGAVLKNLLHQYYEQKIEPENYSKVISRKVNDDGSEIVSIVSWSGPTPVHDECEEITSPDGERLVHVRRYNRDGKHAYTMVNICFPTASGGVYQVDGIHPNVKAYWKDNHTLVIETAKDLVAVHQYHTLQSFDDLVTVEYITT